MTPHTESDKRLDIICNVTDFPPDCQPAAIPEPTATAFAAMQDIEESRR
jgi:hypothetical protein